MTGWLSRPAGGAFGVLARSWRFRVEGEEHLSRVSAGPFLFALWHHQLLPLLWWHRHRSIMLLISRHADGELVARAAARLGYGAVRGSSTRGASGAFRDVVRALAAGHTVAVTPDGPAGPPGVVKAGIIRAARQAGVPILPVSAFAERAWRVRSWDRMVVPQPFSRVCVRYGPPHVPASADAPACTGLAWSLDGLVGRPAAALA